MKKGFTLVEILVVIGIIGLIMASLVYFFGNTESARSAECLVNLKNLANAVQDARNATGTVGRYPLAGSQEGYKIVYGDDGDIFVEYPGWISWNSQGAYASGPRQHISSGSWLISTYCQDENAREYCLTNGALYKYVRNYRTYLCPGHLKKMPSDQRPVWSYVMNGSFGYDYSKGAKETAGDGHPGCDIDSEESKKAHKTLLFAELQWEDYTDNKPDFSAGAGFKNDCTLQYNGSEGAEIIGFNHKEGKDIVAHIVFADGHTDKIIYPKGGLNTSELEKLTEFLCTAVDHEIRDGSVKEID